LRLVCGRLLESSGRLLIARMKNGERNGKPEF
jgi:hypothetical protein